MNVDIKKQEHSQVEISVSLPFEKLEAFRETVVSEALKNVEKPGFRKGHVPKDIALKEINQFAVLEEMAYRAISQAYLEIIESEKLRVIGQPSITITKIAEGSECEFKALTAVVPEIKLGDYKAIASSIFSKKEDTNISDEELSEAILTLRKMHFQKNQDNAETQRSWSEINEDELPPLDIEWIKTLGSFETIDDFTSKMKENLLLEKQAKVSEKKRIEMIEEIIKSSEIEVPQVIVDYELDKMFHEFEHNIAMTGISLDTYLGSINKTREDYKKEWQEQAYKRAQTELLLTQIALDEKITAEDSLVEEQVSQIMNQYKDQKAIDENNVRNYVTTVLTHQKVFAFLENKK